MKNTIALLAALAACAAPEASIGTRGQALMGTPETESNPLTFWWWAGNGAELRPALECALERIRTATCLPLDVSLDAHHWVRQKAPSAMNGRLGHTGGADWDSTRISLKTPMGPQSNCRVLVHELAQHVLQRQNADGHVAPMFRLSAELIESICLVQEARGIMCGCFNPEAEDNPVESTQAECLDPFASEEP